MIVFFLALLLASNAWGNIFYLAPNGSGTTCSNASPCALSRVSVAKPGDTWRLKNGTYTSGVSLNCASGVANGAPGQEIALVADNERQAFLNTNGGIGVNLFSCSYWRIEGLYINQGDNPALNGDVIGAYNNSHHVTIRRNLITFTNRSLATGNSAIITYGGNNQNNILIEENEIYGCYANCVNLKNTFNSELRRNYCNNASNWDQSTGNPAACFTIYPGSQIIVENNFCELVDACLDSEPQDDNSDNSYLGNVALNVKRNVFADRQTGTFTKNSIVKDDVLLAADNGNSYNSWGFQAVVNLTVVGVTWRNQSGACTGIVNATFFSGSFNISNALITGFCGTTGFLFSAGGPWTASHVNSVGNKPNFSPALGASNYTASESTALTGNGNCLIYVPDKSNMKGRGVNGADIGANVLYAYEGGVLTSKKLWTPTGAPTFAGAVVQGVNSQNALVDIGKRLNVNQNNCPFPAKYYVPPTAPTNLAYQLQ